MGWSAAVLAAATAARLRCWVRWARVRCMALFLGRGRVGNCLDVFHQGDGAEVFDDVGVVAGLVVGNAVVLGLVLEVAAAGTFLPVDGQVFEEGDQYGAGGEEGRVDHRQTAQAGTAHDFLGGVFLDVGGGAFFHGL